MPILKINIMKKFFLITLAAICSFGLSAQTTELLKNVSLGVKGGANYSTLQNLNLNVDLNTLLGNFHAGVVARANLTERFGAQAELVYAGKANNFSSNTVTQGNKLHYIDLPVLGRVMLVNNISLHAGPQFSYLMSLKESANFSKDDVKKYDVAIVGGIEYENGKFFGGGRYNFGFIDIYEDTTPTGLSVFGVEEQSFKNNNKVFQVYIGVMF